MDQQPHWRGRRLDAVLFDLDGTLLETAGDIGAVLNLALADRQLGPLPADAVRKLIGRGAPSLVARALQLAGTGSQEVDVEATLGRFCAHYEQLYAGDGSTATAFPGVLEGLRALHAAGLKLAVVTNKQRRFALQVLGRLGLVRWFEAVVGGDTSGQRKPDPRPLHHACELLRVDSAQALMVGDSAIDVRAARAAGMPVICVPYGYNEGQDASTLECDALVPTLAQLPALLRAGGAA
jgi:phosphoglycolate phosphatase